jgi:hypothetical protein
MAKLIATYLLAPHRTTGFGANGNGSLNKEVVCKGLTSCAGQSTFAFKTG